MEENLELELLVILDGQTSNREFLEDVAYILSIDIQEVIDTVLPTLSSDSLDHIEDTIRINASANRSLGEF